MSAFYFKLIPLLASVLLVAIAVRAHERLWDFGFLGWRRVYAGLAVIFAGALISLLFEFVELRNLQIRLGLPVGWLLFAVSTVVGVWLVLTGSFERLAMLQRERRGLNRQQETYDIIEAIREASDSSHSLVEVLDYSLKELIGTSGAAGGVVWLYHENTHEYLLAAASGIPLGIQQQLERITGDYVPFVRIFEHGRLRIFPGEQAVRSLFPEGDARGINYQHALALPMTALSATETETRHLALLLLLANIPYDLTHQEKRLFHAVNVFISRSIERSYYKRTLRTLREQEKEREAKLGHFADWVAHWTVVREPQRRLRLAIAGLADHTSHFIGCSRYHPEDDRWEPLAMAGGAQLEGLLGDPAMRAAAATVITDLEEQSFGAGTAPDAGTTIEYRLIPVAIDDLARRARGIVFLPRADDLPLWWDWAAAIVCALADTALSSQPGPEGVAAFPDLSKVSDRPRPVPPPKSLPQQKPEPEESPLTAPPGRQRFDQALLTWLANQDPPLKLGHMDFAVDVPELSADDCMQLNLLLDWAKILFDSIQETNEPVVDLQYDYGHLTFGLARPDVASRPPTRLTPSAAPLEPIDPAMRELMVTWRGKTRAFSTAGGLSRLLLSVTPPAAAGDRALRNLPFSILVVDEDELIRDLLVGMVEMLDHRALPASSASSGLREFFTDHFDVLIVSQKIAANGTDAFVEQIREYNPRIRLLVIRDQGLVPTAIAGADATLLKPFRLEDLRSALNDVLLDR